MALQRAAQAAAEAAPGCDARLWAISCFLHVGSASVAGVLCELQDGDSGSRDAGQAAPLGDPRSGDGDSCRANEAREATTAQRDRLAGATIKCLMLLLRIAESEDTASLRVEDRRRQGTHGLSGAAAALLVPLLLESAAPRAHSAAPAPLAATAARLITHLAQSSGAQAEAFKAAVAALPVSDKQRLQRALSERHEPQQQRPSDGPRQLPRRIQLDLSSFRH